MQGTAGGRACGPHHRLLHGAGVLRPCGRGERRRPQGIDRERALLVQRQVKGATLRLWLLVLIFSSLAGAIGLAAIFARQAERGIIRRWLLTILPLGAVFLLYALFSFSEFFRSWSDFYSQRQDSFLWFSLIRLVGYYATAMNNGAALLQELHSNPIPYLTIEWFWKFPVLKNFLTYSDLTGVDPETHYIALLKSAVNPEFNNPSGIFPVVMDYGLIGALVFWFCAGIIAILLYRLFLS